MGLPPGFPLIFSRRRYILSPDTCQSSLTAAHIPSMQQQRIHGVQETKLHSFSQRDKTCPISFEFSTNYLRRSCSHFRDVIVFLENDCSFYSSVWSIRSVVLEPPNTSSDECDVVSSISHQFLLMTSRQSCILASLSCQLCQLRAK